LKKLKTKLLFISLIFLFWFWRYQAVKPPEIPEGAEVRIRGVLREEPASSAGQSQTFHLQGIRVRTSRFPEYHYGDYLMAAGAIQAGRLNYPEIQILEMRGEKPGVMVWLLKFRQKIETIYNQVLSEPQASLLSGIVIGRKRGLPFDFSQALKKTGTMHVVVASGANISLAAQPLLNGLAGILPRPLALSGALVFVWLYALMAGGEAPVIRAAIMASLALLAQLTGREKKSSWSLLLAASLMLLVKPLLVFDLGFQLSFGATLGILLFYPRWRPFFQKLKFFGNDLATTLAAQVFVLPLIYFHFRQISWISPFVNALVLWTIDPLMKLGGLIAGLGLFSLPLAQVIAYPAWLLLTIFIKIIETFAC